MKKTISKAKSLAPSMDTIKRTASGVSQGLPPMAKNLLAFAAVGAVIYVGYQLLSAPGKIKGNAGNKDELSDAQKELDKVNKTATLSASQAGGIANAIFAAMDGYGTDEDAIVYQLGKIKNNADFLLVQTKYGIRTISSGRFNPEPNYKGNLAGSIGSECSSYWIKKINSALSKKGVTYKV